MASKTTERRAKRALRAGKRPTAAAGAFVRAIGVSKARRAGVPLKPPKPGQAKEGTRRSAERDYQVGQKKRKTRTASARKAAASRPALERELRSPASRAESSKQARRAATRRRKRKADR